MNAPLRTADLQSVQTGAIVVGAELTAGHDGQAELLVRLRHENGVEAPMILDPDTGLALMRGSGADSLSGLIGRAWRDLIKGL